MKDIKFEEGLKLLEEIVNNLEKGDLSLEESLSEFEKGVAIYKELNKILNKVEGKVKIILNDNNDNYCEEDFIDEM